MVRDKIPLRSLQGSDSTSKGKEKVVITLKVQEGSFPDEERGMDRDTFLMVVS